MVQQTREATPRMKLCLPDITVLLCRYIYAIFICKYCTKEMLNIHDVRSQLEHDSPKGFCLLFIYFFIIFIIITIITIIIIIIIFFTFLFTCIYLFYLFIYFFFWGGRGWAQTASSIVHIHIFISFSSQTWLSGFCLAVFVHPYQLYVVNITGHMKKVYFGNLY